MDFDKPIERPHKTVIVEVGDWKAEIDEGLAPLISEIWKAGIETTMCCEEVLTGIAWIEFDSVKELLRFLNLVICYESGVDTLYNRINHQRIGPMSAPEWWYQLNLDDIYEEEEESVTHRLAHLEAMVGVYFPTTDIPLLLQRLTVVNSRS